MVRILFVDDNEIDLLVLRRAIRPATYAWDTTFVSSARDALNAMEESDFDVIVSDMQMPEMNGLELLEATRQRHPEMVRIMLSTLSEEEADFHGKKPADAWMSKPCDTERLKDLIDRIGKQKGFKDVLLKQ